MVQSMHHLIEHVELHIVGLFDLASRGRETFFVQRTTFDEKQAYFSTR